MSNTPSAIDFQHKIVTSDYKPVQQIQDQCLGDLIQMKSQKTDHLVLMKEKIFPDFETYKSEIGYNTYHLALKHNNLAKVLGLAGADTQSSPDAKFKINMYFEQFPTTLQQVITKRKAAMLMTSDNFRVNGQFFTETELFNILSQLIDVLGYLQQNGVSHGDIRPETCFVTEEGKIAIYNRKLICNEASAFKLAEEGNCNVFITPLAVEYLEKKLNEPVQDKYKADMFSLGLTILECATLKQSSQIYNWDSFTIDRNLFCDRLLEVRERYSLDFYKVIRGMVQLEEGQRPDFITLRSQFIKEGRIKSIDIPLQFLTEEQANQEQLGHVESNNISLVQDELSRDTIRDTLGTPNKTIFPKQLMDSHEKISLGKHKPAEIVRASVKPLVFKKALLNKDILDEDGCVPFESTVRINTVPLPPVNRSGEKFLNSRPFLEATLDFKSDNLLYEKIMIQRRESDRTPGSGKVRDRVSRIYGSAVTSQSNIQGKECNDLPRGIRTEVKNRKSRPIFPQKSEAASNENFTSKSAYASEMNNQNRTTLHTYGEIPTSNINFLVENLMKGASQRSEKNQVLNTEMFSQTSHSKNKASLGENNNRGQGILNLNSCKLDLNPIFKSQLSPIPSFENTKNLNTVELLSAKKMVDLFSNTNGIKGSESPSEITYFAANSQNSIPHTYREDWLAISSLNSQRNVDTPRTADHPEVVDLVDEMNEVNKALIDSIVHPQFLTSKINGQGLNTLQVINTPSSNTEVRRAQKPPSQAHIRRQNSRQGADSISSTPRAGSRLNDKITSIFQDTKESRNILDTSLEDGLKPDVKRPQYTLTSKELSTKEELVGQENNSDKFLKGSGNDYFSSKKLPEEDDYDVRVQQALERSKQTYLLATMGSDVKMGFRLSVKPFASRAGKVTDRIPSLSCLNDSQVRVTYEVSESRGRETVFSELEY